MNTDLHFRPYWLALAVLLFLGIVAPVVDFFIARSLRKSSSSAQRIGNHLWVIGVLWASTAVAVSMLGVNGIATAGGALDEAAATLSNPWIRYPILAITLAISAAFLSPLLMLPFKPKVRDAYARAVRKVSYVFFLPATTLERWSYGLLSVSAGVCEEVVFRSFIVAYLHIGLGWNLWIAFLVSALVFGVNHGYQGAGGILKAGGMAVVFGFLYFVTHSLVPPILVHALLDLQVLVLLKPDWHRPPQPQTAPTPA